MIEECQYDFFVQKKYCNKYRKYEFIELCYLLQKDTK